MMTDSQVNKKCSRKKALNVLKWSVILSAGLGLLIFFGVPIFLSSAGGTRLLLGKINASVDGQVHMQDFSIGWFKGVELTNLSYDDSAGTTSVKVNSIHTQPSYASLLGGKVKLGKTIVDHPQVYVKVLPEEPASGKVSPQAAVGVSGDKPAPVFPIHEIDLEVINGVATVELAGENAQTVSFANIASKVNLEAPGKESTLDVSMEIPNGENPSTLTAKGSVTTDKTGWTMKGGKFDVKISNLQLESLRPLLAMAGRDMDAAGELNAEAKIEVADSQLRQVKADAVITDFAQGIGEQRVAFEKPVELHASVANSDGHLLIDRAYVKSEFCQAECFGLPESLTYDINADLAQTQRFIAQFVPVENITTQGELTAEGVLNMTDQVFASTGKTNIKKLLIQKDGRATPVTDVSLTYDCAMDQASNVLKISTANLAAAPGTVNISNLSLPLAEDASKDIALDATAKLDLAKAWEFAEVFVDASGDMKISGMLNSTLKATTVDSQVRLLTDNTQIDRFKIQQGDGEPFAQNRLGLAGEIGLDLQTQQYDIRKLVLAGDKDQLVEVKKGVYKTDMTGTNTKITGDFELAYDWDAIAPLMADYLPEGLTLAGKRTDRLHFESEYPTDKPDQRNANLNANATLGFASASYNGLNFGDTSMTLNVKKGLLGFEIPQTVVNDGTFRFAGQVDLNAEAKVLRLKEPMQVLEDVHVNEQITRTMLAKLNPLFADQGNVSGYASLTCDQLEVPFDAAEKDKLLIDGVVAIDKAILISDGLIAEVLGKKNDKPVDARMLPTHFLVKDELISYNSMEFHLDEYPVGFSGLCRFDGYFENLKIAIPWRIDTRDFGMSSVKIGDDLSKRIVRECQGYPTDILECLFSPEKNVKDVLDNVLKDEERVKETIEDIIEIFK